MTTSVCRRQPLIGATALALAFIAVGAGAMAGTASTRAQAQAPRTSPCVSLTRVAALPQLALVDTRVGVTTSVVVLCAGESFPLHIVLVLDGSRSMAGESTEALKREMHQLVDRLDLANDPTTSMAVVEIHQPSKRLCALTNDPTEVHACIDRLAADGGSDIAGAVGIGIETIRAGRASGHDRDSIREVLLVVTDGGNTEGCGPLMFIAGQAKDQGILVMSACVTSGCEVVCTRLTATAPRYFFEFDQMDQLGNLFETIRKQFHNIIVKYVAVTETLGSAFELVEGSVVPEPRTIDSRRIDWLTSDPIPKDGVSLTLGVRPIVAGLDLPVLASAVGWLEDNKNRRAALAFDLPRIDVLDARYGIPPPPLTATVPISNRLAVDASRATVGQPFRVLYHLQLPDGDAARLNTAVVHLRTPDHIRVRATRRSGRSDGQADTDGHGAKWMIVGTRADVLDLEAEVVATEPGDGGFGVIVYRWPLDNPLDPAEPVVAAVSAPVTIDRAPTPGPTLSPGPTPTSTPRPHRIYLPVAVAEACLSAQPSDVVAVVDASTSMAERLPGGGTKRSAASAALTALAAGLRGDRDRLALVTFNRIATIRAPLDGDGDAVAAAYLAVPPSDGASIEAGITVAGALLAGSERRPEARGVIVLLTDGRIYPEKAARAAADAAKSAGTLLLTVGVGPEVNRPLLTALASSPDHAFVAPDGAMLVRTLGRVAAGLGCERTAFWGGRAK